jgi:hypothetical protein
MTKSALALARTALEVAEKALPAYSSKFSARKFTQHQHVAILTVRQFFGLDYRGVQQLFLDWSDLRDVLDLEAVPHWTAIEKAEKRLMKKGARRLDGTRHRPRLALFRVPQRKTLQDEALAEALGGRGLREPLHRLREGHEGPAA